MSLDSNFTPGDRMDDFGRATSSADKRKSKFECG